MSDTMNSFEIAMLIKEIYSMTTNSISNSLKPCGLTHQQIMVMKLIGHKKKITISQLCEEMSLAKGTVSGIVQRLENAGYVKKIKDDKDKRNTYVVFSEKGLEFAKEFRTSINNTFDKLFESLSIEEHKKIEEALKLLSKKMKESEE
ncbi:MarR family winged helix-turn-helix transcriptional regulator [Clostridium senegalense]|uniref:MarR family winged helix-turn-helix transcriptional regulator n=1 Tax=Clostridium senegalense TaxID=1465809 RepID=UPI003CC82036